jgi:arylsulfatase A-like enzyme
LYDQGIRYTDHWIGELAVGLEARGLSGSTVVVVTADHGEEFGEHGGRYHATTLYDEVLHVPFMIAGQGAARGERTEPLGCRAFLGTVLRAAGLEQEAVRDRGGQTARTRSLRETSPFEPRLHSVVYGGYKIVLDLATGLTSYFDLRRDPGETRKLSHAPPPLERELVARLDAWLSDETAELPASDWAHVVAAR